MLPHRQRLAFFSGASCALSFVARFVCFYFVVFCFASFLLLFALLADATNLYVLLFVSLHFVCIPSLRRLFLISLNRSARVYTCVCARSVRALTALLIFFGPLPESRERG